MLGLLRIQPDPGRKYGLLLRHEGGRTAISRVQNHKTHDIQGYPGVITRFKQERQIE